MSGEKEEMGYCGIHCGSCKMYTGEIQRRARELMSLIEEYRFEDWIGFIISPEKHEQAAQEMQMPEVEPFEFEDFKKGMKFFSGDMVVCPSCVGGGGPPMCEIRMCVKEKGISGCWECVDMPCDKLGWVIQAHPPLANDLHRIKEVGVERWLKEQETKC